MEKKQAPPKPILAEVVELMRDLAAEGLHGARLGRDLGGRLLEVTLGSGAAEELRAEATASLGESADALRRAVAANLELARNAVAVQGRALDWTAALFETWLAARSGKDGGAGGGGGDGKPRTVPTPDRGARRANLATFLRVIDGLRGERPARTAPAAPRLADTVLRLTAAGGTATLHLLHPGPDEVHARFQVGACVREGGGAPFRAHVELEPEELTLRPKVEEPIRITMPWDARFEAGATYRLPIVVSGLGAQVVVHVIVGEGSAT